MVNLVTYIQKITPEEQFNDAYIEEVYDLEHVRTTPKLLRLIVHAKYEKSDLHLVMETQCQHLTMT